MASSNVRSWQDFKYRTKDSDENKAGDLARAIEGMSIHSLSSFGGRVHDKSKNPPNLETFTMHSPPDVGKRTRIIAVLGILQGGATPQCDGWFLSDFFAFWHLLHGMTISQTWLHCLDLEQLIQTHERYLHGDPHIERKVVLDADILANAQQSLTRVTPGQLKYKLTQKITAEARDAEKAGEDVLILMFGHGDKDLNGILIGEKSFQKGEQPTLTIKNFKAALKKFKVNITVLATHCFSGGWTCHPDINMTTLTAAGPDEPSRSWRYSASCSRASGSMFATAMIHRLTRDIPELAKEADNDDDDDNEEQGQEISEQRSKSYAEFARSIYHNLLTNIDRRGYEHNMTFGAQDDEWAMHWQKRTGIPLAAFESRWEKLEDWGRDRLLHPGDPENRNPYITDAEKAEYLAFRAECVAHVNEHPEDRDKYFIKGQKAESTGASGTRKTSALYGGGVEGLASVVCSQGQTYLDSYQGHDDTGNDGALHNLIYGIISGRVTAEDQIEEASRAIEYRLRQQSAADKYLEIMDLAQPDGKECLQFDASHMSDRVGADKYRWIEKVIFARRIIFPRPTALQGRFFYKGHHYLIAAFHAAKSTQLQVVEKLDSLARILEADLEEQKDILMQVPEVTSKRRKLHEAFNKAFVSMSPSKRRSRGHSLTGAAF